MALDKLVDSSQLDTDLTSVANAIRTKGGTSAQLAFPAGFVSAINDISGGGGTNYLDYATQIRFANNAYPSTVVDLTLPNATSLADMFYCDNTQPKYTSITVTFAKQITSVLEFDSEYSGNNNALTSLTLNGDTSKVTRWNDLVKRAYKLTEVKGTPLNFSSTTNNNYGTWASSGSIPLLTYVRYAPNTLKVNQILDSPVLDNASIVSVANGLQAVARTLTLHADVKAKLPNIMGTVTNNGTYDLFTEDAQGQTSLQSFITTTKGWTIA